MASLPPVLGLSIFFRLAISISLFRCFCAYKLWQDNFWKIPNDFIKYFAPSFITDFIGMIGIGNLLFATGLCLALCVTATIALISILIASRWIKPQTQLELQALQTSHLSPEAASQEQDALIQNAHTFSTLQGTALLLILEAILGLFAALFLASTTLVLTNNPAQVVIHFWDFSFTAQTITINKHLLAFSVLLGSEALIRGIPLLLISLSLWLMLSRRDPKPHSLGEQFMETLTLHPYSLLLAALAVGYTGITSLFFGGHPAWYLVFPISSVLVAIAFSVFLSTDMKERLNQLELALEKRKALLGLSQPTSPIALEVSETLSKLYHLHHIDSVRLEALNQYPSESAQSTNAWQARLENLVYLNQRVKFMHGLQKRLICEPGTGSDLLYQLQTLYDNLEQELGQTLTPIQIHINQTLGNGQYQLLVHKKVKTQGEINLSEDATLRNQAIQDIVQHIKTALLSNMQQQ